MSKWSSMTRLVAAGDEDEMLDAGLARLVDDILDDRPVDDRQHFLGDRLGGRQEARAETGNRENCFADFFHDSRVPFGWRPKHGGASHFRAGIQRLSRNAHSAVRRR